MLTISICILRSFTVVSATEQPLRGSQGYDAAFKIYFRNDRFNKRHQDNTVWCFYGEKILCGHMLHFSNCADELSIDMHSEVDKVLVIPSVVFLTSGNGIFIDP